MGLGRQLGLLQFIGDLAELIGQVGIAWRDALAFAAGLGRLVQPVLGGESLGEQQEGLRMWSLLEDHARDALALPRVGPVPVRRRPG